MMLLILVFASAPSFAASNVYAEPCVKATVAAIACCGRWHCETKEILATVGNLLDEKTRASTDEQADPKVGAARLAGLMEKDTSLKSGMAELCVGRAETCLKNCSNAVKLGPLDKVSAYVTNRKSCQKLKERGDKVAASAEADSSAADAGKQEAAAKIVAASSDPAGTLANQRASSGSGASH